MKKWTMALFMRVVWEMLGRKGHFVYDFKQSKYGEMLEQVYKEYGK